MTSTREQVLVRLAALCHVDGVSRVTRNDEVVGEETGDRPLVQIWDGNEEGNTADPVVRRKLGQPRRIVMTPHIYIMVGENVTTVGTTLNGLVERIQNAVEMDETLDQILGSASGHIEYSGLGDPTFPQGRVTEGEQLIRYNFHYVRRPI
jgi:hypothetical protein